MRLPAAVLAILLSAVSADAQPKPIGLFDAGQTPPAWASFGTIPDWASDAQMATARHLSLTRGFRWLLQLGYTRPVTEPIGAHAAAVRAKFDAAGLLPYLAAVTVREEWYEHWASDAFAVYGLPATAPNGPEVIADWLGRQHAAAKAALGVPVLWITTLANNDRAAGPYRPIPTGTDLVAIDAYVHAGGTFAQHVAPILAHAERTTHLPLVLIPQWFQHPGDPLWDTGPQASDVALYFDWFARPRWVAMLGFTWQSRPWNGLVGLKDLPEIRAAVETRIGGHP